VPFHLKDRRDATRSRREAASAFHLQTERDSCVVVEEG
jgi:hypothetical protein